MRSILLPLLVILALGGCGAAVDAPSLGLRPVEKLPIAAPDDAAEPAVALDPALAGRIAPLTQAAEDGHSAFLAQQRQVAAAVARAGAKESEGWIVAQQAVSALDSARGPVRDAAGGIEALRQDPANAGSGNRGAIEAAAARVEALEAAEAAAVQALAGRLG